MASIYDAAVGIWYRTSEGRLFEVVSLDDETIEIQYNDGDLEELDHEYWMEMKFMPASPPAPGLLSFDSAEDGAYEMDRHTLSEVLGTIEYTD